MGSNTSITYITGDATNPPPPAIIAHICNNKGGWGAGFTGALSSRWPSLKEQYKLTLRQRNQGLGDAQFIFAQSNIIIANMIAQDGYSRPGRAAIDYGALQLCLSQLCKIAQRYPAYGVHMPRIGTGLAGGDWTVIEPMIVRELCEKGVQVTVYDEK